MAKESQDKKDFDPRSLETLPNPQIPYDFAYILKTGLQNHIYDWLSENAPEEIAELHSLAAVLEVYTHDISTNKDGKASPMVNMEIADCVNDALRLIEKVGVDFNKILRG